MNSISLSNLSILTKIERLVNSINSIKIDSDESKDLKKHASQTNAIFYVKCLNISLPKTEINKIIKGKSYKPNNPHYQLILNYSNVITLIKNSSSNTLNLNYLQHINRLLTNNIVEIWNQGRIRNSSDAKIQTDYNFIAYKLTNEDPTLLDKLNKIILQPPELIYSFLVLDILLKSLPFYTLNLATAILGSFAQIYNTPYNVNGYISYIEFLYGYLSTYWNSDLSSEEYNLQRFLVSFKNNLENLYKQLILHQKIPRSILRKLNKRQRETISYLKRNIRIDRKEYTSLFNISPETAFRDLKELLRLGIIVRNGKGRSTYYTLK